MTWAGHFGKQGMRGNARAKREKNYLAICTTIKWTPMMPQRSPIIFWLLLAATLSVDALVWTWPWPKNLDRPYVLRLQGPLITGQLSAICVWSVLRIKRPAWVQIMPWLAAVVASIATPELVFSVISRFRVAMTYHGVFVALHLAALWLFERTLYWRRCTGLSRVWSYSVAQLLLTMMIVAALVASIRYNPEFNELLLAFGTVICGQVAVTISSLICWSSSRHVLIRLAGTLGSALVVVFAIGLAFNLRHQNLSLELFKFTTRIFGPEFLIQALVLSVWIGIGEILPASRPTIAAGD